MNKARYYILAARPKTLTAAVIPVAVGSLIAANQTGVFELPLFLAALTAALLIQIYTNYINDIEDGLRGADRHRKMGPKRMLQSGNLSLQDLRFASWIILGSFFLAGAPLIYHFGWPMLGLFLFSALFAYLYTGGPCPLAYRGLGEIFVFLFFGLVATLAPYIIQGGLDINSALIPSIQIGSLATLIIAMNNYRDAQEDVKANKITLAVRLGPIKTKALLTGLTLLPFILLFFNGGALPLLALPLGLVFIDQLYRETKDPQTLFEAAAKLHLIFGLLLIVALLAKVRFGIS